MAGGDWKEMTQAAERGDLDLVEYHVRNGIDVNYQHPEFLTTPLIEAAMWGKLEVVKFLLENGADPRIKGMFDGMTALEAAKAFSRRKVVKFLKRYLKEHP